MEEEAVPEEAEQESHVATAEAERAKEEAERQAAEEADAILLEEEERLKL